MYDEEGRKIDLGQQIGMPLSNMSLTDLENYILSMKNEIRRVEDEIKRKKESSAAADTFFSR